MSPPTPMTMYHSQSLVNFNVFKYDTFREEQRETVDICIYTA